MGGSGRLWKALGGPGSGGLEGACQFAPFLHIQAQEGLERVGEFLHVFNVFNSFNFFIYVLELSCKASYGNHMNG